MIHIPVLVLSALAVAAFPVSGGRLLSERTDGARRLCLYEVRNAASRRPQLQVQRRIGLGEPCPHRDPGAPRPQEQAIPSLAVLSGERQTGNVRFCYYSHLGRRYSRPVDRAQRCPLTPHFFD